MNEKDHVGSSFHLLVAPRAPGPDGASAPPSAAAVRGWCPLSVPPGPSRLSDIAAGTPGLAVPPLSAGAEEIWMEPVRRRVGESRLLLVAPDRAELVVNELRHRGAVLLKERDQFRWEDVTFHVAIFHRPQIGPAPPEKVGQECKLCRVPLAAEARCYVCTCGAAFHYEEDEQKGLLCVTTLSACPVCSRPIRLKEGYSYLPEDGHE